MKAIGLIGLMTMAVWTSALAQGTPPKVGSKPILQVKPKTPIGCKLVGTVKGTKIWSGECTDASEMRAAPAAEATSLPSLPAQAAGAIPPGEKQ